MLDVINSIGNSIGVLLISIFKGHIDSQEFNGIKYDASYRVLRNQSGENSNKKIIGDPNKTLIKTGDLYNSFSYKFEYNNGIISIKVSNDTDYIQYHEYPSNGFYIDSDGSLKKVGLRNTTRSDGKSLIRPVMDLTNGELNTIKKEVVNLWLQ